MKRTIFVVVAVSLYLSMTFASMAAVAPGPPRPPGNHEGSSTSPVRIMNVIVYDISGFYTEARILWYVTADSKCTVEYWAKDTPFRFATTDAGLYWNKLPCGKAYQAVGYMGNSAIAPSPNPPLVVGVKYYYRITAEPIDTLNWTTGTFNNNYWNGQ